MQNKTTLKPLMRLKESEKGLGRKTIPSWLLFHVCDTGFCKSQLCHPQRVMPSHPGPEPHPCSEFRRARNMWASYSSVSAVQQITRNLDLQSLIYLWFQLLWTQMKPPGTFARNIYIQTHASAQRHFENPPQTRHALQAPFLLQQSKSVFPEFLCLHERESPQTKTQFAGSAPRGSATQPPYMDMYFQIWEENPKSDLGSEPKNP